jgi:hypothetical protein
VGVKDSSSDSGLIKNIIDNGLPLQPIIGNDQFLADILKQIKMDNLPYERLVETL